MLQLVSFALRYLPLILSAIALVENLVDKSTPGEDKKAAVIKVVKEALAKFGVTVTPQIETFISQVIDLAVTILNLFGVFKRKEDEEAEVVEAIVPAAVVKAAATGTKDRLDELESLLIDR